MSNTLDTYYQQAEDKVSTVAGQIQTLAKGIGLVTRTRRVSWDFYEITVAPDDAGFNDYPTRHEIKVMWNGSLAVGGAVGVRFELGTWRIRRATVTDLSSKNILKRLKLIRMRLEHAAKGLKVVRAMKLVRADIAAQALSQMPESLRSYVKLPDIEPGTGVNVVFTDAIRSFKASAFVPMEPRETFPSRVGQVVELLDHAAGVAIKL